jgi:hypothetical protein
MLALGVLTAYQGVFYLCFFGILGLCAAVFGIWMLVNGSRATRLRAVVTPEGLHLVAHQGRHLMFQRGLVEATIPWAEIQGFSDMRTLNMATPSHVQTTYVLYTSRGDFTLNDVQWDHLSNLMQEVSARTGRMPGQVAPERAAAQADVKAGERRVYSFQRIFGWIIVVICTPLMLLVVIAGLAQGFSADLGRATSYLLLALTLGGSMTRYYKK